MSKISNFGHPFDLGNGMPWYKELHPLLLDYVRIFPIYTKLIGGASDGIYELLMVKIMSWLPKLTLKYHAKIEIWAPSQHGKWDDMAWEETSIVAWEFHNHHQMYKDDWKSFYQLLKGQHAAITVLFLQKQLSHFMQYSDFGHPLNIKNEVSCYEERHTLLLEIIITFPDCIRMIEWGSNSIYEPLLVRTVLFLRKKQK